MNRPRWFLPLTLAALVLPTRATAQDRSSVTGQVIAEHTREPLQGVRVTIPALNVATVTDRSGRFVLSDVPLGSHSLRMTRIGYKPMTRDVSVGVEPATLTVEMAGDPLRLDELVVTGYGEQRRRDIGGAVGSLKPSEVAAEVPATSVSQLLQARVPGVLVIQNSGVPGAAITVRVRGSSSISAANEPLYVVDGVPVTQVNPSALNLGFGGQTTDAISDLNSAEIENIVVLKDASAAAIYGARASNGVVLISTKRGTADRTEFTVGGYYGTQKEWRRVQFLNAQQYMDVYNEGFTNRWGPASEWDEDGDGLADGYTNWYGYESDGFFYNEFPDGTNTDWLETILRRAPIANIEGSVRGGTDRVRYYASGGSLVQDGIIRSMGYRRLNGRLNLDYQPFERLTLGTNMSLARRVTERAVADNSIYSTWSNGLAIPPVEPAFVPGTNEYYETFYANPVAVDREREAWERGTRTLANAFANYTLFEGVTGRLSYGLDQLTTNSRAWDSPNWGFWEPSGGRAQQGAYFVTKVVYEGTLSFNREVRPGHALSGVVGSSYEDNWDEWHYTQGLEFPTEHFKYVADAATIDDGHSERNDWGLQSYFGRATYTFDDRISTTISMRRDGSSRFGANHKFGTFPSASVLWRIGDEAFMQNQNVVGNLVVRASYGITGNQPTDNFAARGLWGGGFNYQDQAGTAPSQLSNPDLRWEKTAQMNLGLDFSVLSDRVVMSLDYYDKRTDDLLIERPVPPTSGFESIWSNIGAMRNRGVELSLSARLLQSAAARSGLQWSTTVNLSRNRNKVTALFDDQPISAGFANRVEVGEPLGFFYGYVTSGLFQVGDPICLTQTGETTADRNARCATAGIAFQSSRTAPGDIRFRDLNGDGIINSSDQAKIGNPWPDLEGGITNTLSFRGFDLSAFIQFSLGNDIFNANGIYMNQYGSFGDNHTIRALRRWTPTNTNTTEPRAVDGDPNQNTRDSDRFIEDGSFWRLKNIVLGYTLPNSVARRLGYRTARIYVQAQNLVTFTDYSGFDPEVNTTGQGNTALNSAVARGTDFYTMPQQRTFTFGFNLSF